MRVISDSTPLIHLSKIGYLSLLKEVFEEIIIPPGVYEEIIIAGKKRGQNEVRFIEELILEKFIFVKEPKTVPEIAGLDKGEKECISLCKELSVKNILIDEKEGFHICEMFSLIPLRTTSLLIILLDKKIIHAEKYKEILRKLLGSGYFLDVRTYEKLLSIGERMNKE